MKKLFFSSIIILSFIPVLALGQSKSQEKSFAIIPSINSNEFKGFENCEPSKKLSKTLDRLISTMKPNKKEKDFWNYAVKTNVMGLPVKKVSIGVCDASGMRACGWGSYLALTIDKPFQEVRSYLKKKTGIDYTKEKRDEITGITLRPVLEPENKGSAAILSCDPGSL